MGLSALWRPYWLWFIIFFVSTPILLTKLSIPKSRPALVHRHRLIEQLNNGLQQKLTLVSAPAGFGKTTVVTDWLQTEGDNRLSPFYMVWLSLDEGDNDPVQFLIYLIASFVQAEAMDVKFGNGLQNMLQSPQPPPLDSILISLINEISTSLDQIVIIFDDYHRIQAQPIHDILTFLLENLPPLVHVIITTREDPGLPLARLRAQNQLSDLRASDLLFTYEEAEEFLNQVMGLSLSAEDIDMLEIRTEGWIAGLQLAAISMQVLDDTTSFIQTFSGSDRLVIDYLIEEVINQQPEDIQNFLLRTAILNQLSGPLCNAITGRGDSQFMLEMLDRANLFIIPLDNDRHWYRYHHLFADLLRQRLRQSQSEKIQILHSRASEWYEKNGYFNEAIDNAFIADDFDRAINLIEEQIDDLWSLGENTRLKHWLQKIPETLLNVRPDLCIFHAWYSFLSNRPEDAERTLQIVEQTIDSSNSDNMVLSGRLAVVRAYLMTYTGDMLGVIKFSRLALDFLPEKDLIWRNLTFIAMGDAYSHLGDMKAAHDIRTKAVKVWQATGGIYWILVASLKLATTLRNQGQLQAATEIYQQQMHVANEFGLSQIRAISWLLGSWAEVLAEINELETATQLTEKALELVKHGWDEATIALGCMCFMRILFSKVDITGASELINKMEKIARESQAPPWWARRMIAAWQVRVWLVQNRLEPAAQWAKEREAHLDGEILFVGEIENIVLARVFIAQGRLDEALNLLQRLFEAAEIGGRISKEIEILILQSLVYQAGKDIEQAVTVLENALKLAKPGGFIRVFVDEGQSIARLLYEALSRGIETDYIQKLLAVFPETGPEKAPDKQKEISDGTWIEPLSDRELEVLQLIAQGFSRREIASQLVLSFNTVKTHARNIFSKLGVNNQMQAVGKARGLGLLETD